MDTLKRNFALDEQAYHKSPYHHEHDELKKKHEEYCQILDNPKKLWQLIKKRAKNLTKEIWFKYNPGGT